MADIDGMIPILGTISPTDLTNDTYATHDELFGKGGYRTVNTLLERNNIPIDRRKSGMLVYVLEDGNRYKLENDLTTWTIDFPTKATVSPESKLLNANLEWTTMTVGSGGHSANVYLSDDTSITNSSYKSLSYTPSMTEAIKTIIVNNNEVLGQTYIFDKEVGVTTLDSGVWSFNCCISVSAVAGNTKLKIVTFKRDINGIETDLFTSYSDTIENTTLQTIEFRNIQSAFNVSTTDKIGFRVYGLTTRTSNTTISYIVGDGRSSYIVTPLATRHNQLRALNEDENYQHITQAEKDIINNLNTLIDGGIF